MAPLKVCRYRCRARDLELYPWLRGHGSIEGTWQQVSGSYPSAYPWLRGHGSIEGAPDGEGERSRRTAYPWLRGHGSIEGRDALGVDVGVLLVSMAERSWLH